MCYEEKQKVLYNNNFVMKNKELKREPLGVP